MKYIEYYFIQSFSDIFVRSYVGSELVQIKLGLPLAKAKMFQAILFFFLLTVDILIYKRVRAS